MSTRSQPSTLLLVLILIITFPFWVTIGALLIGVFAGLFGALIGIIAAIFGVLVTILVLPFKILFGWGDWDFHPVGIFHLHNQTYVLIAAILIVAFFLRRQKSAS